MSVVAVYAPTEVCETEEKEMFYAKLDSVLDQCSHRDALIVLGDLNAVTGTERAGCEICVCPHGSGSRNDNSSFLLSNGCETWTLNTGLKRLIDAFGTRCLCRIMGYRWYDIVSNQRLFNETDSRPITSIVRQRQLRQYAHVARYPEADHACRVVSVRDNPTWRRPRGRPQNSWLRQVDASCWESLGMRREPESRLARRDRQGWVVP